MPKRRPVTIDAVPMPSGRYYAVPKPSWWQRLWQHSAAELFAIGFLISFGLPMAILIGGVLLLWLMS